MKNNTYIHTYMHAYIHTYIHTYITYIHTDRQTDKHTYNSSALVSLQDGVLKFMKVVNNTYEALIEFGHIYIILFIYIYIIYRTNG